jgi:hypothetical protein
VLDLDRKLDGERRPVQKTEEGIGIRQHEANGGATRRRNRRRLGDLWDDTESVRQRPARRKTGAAAFELTGSGEDEVGLGEQWCQRAWRSSARAASSKVCRGETVVLRTLRLREWNAGEKLRRLARNWRGALTRKQLAGAGCSSGSRRQEHLDRGRTRRRLQRMACALGGRRCLTVGPSARRGGGRQVDLTQRNFHI